MIEMFKTEIVYDKPCYEGTSILDLSKLGMMEFHYGVIQKDFKENSNLIYSDTDSSVYSITHLDIYEWVKENREHVDLPDSVRPDMKDTTNRKALGKFKDEMNTLTTKKFIARNPKVYSITHQHSDDKTVYHVNYDKKTLKGVPKVLVKEDITHDDYVKENQKGGIRITSKKHQLYTITQEKTALTSFYDKQVMIGSINCVPSGYKQK